MTRHKSLLEEDTQTLRKVGLVVLGLVVIMLVCIGVAVSI